LLSTRVRYDRTFYTRSASYLNGRFDGDPWPELLYCLLPLEQAAKIDELKCNERARKRVGRTGANLKSSQDSTSAFFAQIVTQHTINNMPKRKRENDSPGATAATSFKQQRVQLKLKTNAAKLRHAFKVAKGFERQKLSRRRKDAESGKNEKKKSVERIDDEVAALKVLT